MIFLYLFARLLANGRDKVNASVTVQLD